MALNKTHCGKLLHTNFIANGLPSGWTETEASSGTVMYWDGTGGGPANNLGAGMTWLGNSGAAGQLDCVTCDTSMPADHYFVVRAKLKCGYYDVNTVVGLKQSATQPAIPYSYADDIGLVTSPAQYQFNVETDLTQAGDNLDTDPHIFEFACFGTGGGNNIHLHMRDATTFASEYDRSITKAITNPFWLTIGDHDDVWAFIAYGWCAYAQAYESNDIAITGLQVGNAAKLFAADDTEMDADVIAMGTTAWLDTSTCDMDSNPDADAGGFNGYINVYEDNTYAVILATYTAADIWGGDTYEYIAMATPTVTSISPDNGDVGDTVPVTIEGADFVDPNHSVYLSKAGESDIVASSVVVVSGTEITCDFDLSGAAVGSWTVVVANDAAHEGSLVDGFTVNSITPVITDINPDSGYVGDTITITGTNFANFTGYSRVSIGSVDIDYNDNEECLLSWSDTEIVFRIPAGTVSDEVVVRVYGAEPSDGVPLEVLTGRILRFVSHIHSITGGATSGILLDINDSDNYCLDEIEYPLPDPRIEYRDPARKDGRSVALKKWENRIVHLTMNVFGATETILSTNIRALFGELLESWPILEWRANGWTDSLYFDLVSPPTKIDPHDWFETWKREWDGSKFLSNLELDLEADSYVRGARRGPHWLSLELLTDPYLNEWSPDYSPPIPEYYVPITVGDGTVSMDIIEYILESGVELSTTGAGDTAGLETWSGKHPGLHTIDPTKHYNIKAFVRKTRGTANLSLLVEALYSGGSTVLTIASGMDPDIDYWRDIAADAGDTSVIYPAGSGEPSTWPAGTISARITIQTEDTDCDVTVGYLGFRESDAYQIAAHDAGMADNGRPYVVEVPALLKVKDIVGDGPAPALIGFDAGDRPAVVPFASFYIGSLGSRTPERVMILKPGTTRTPGGSDYTEFCLSQFYSEYTAGTGGEPFFIYSADPGAEVIRGRYYPIVKLRTPVDPGAAELTLTAKYESPDSEPIIDFVIGVANYDSLNGYWMLSGETVNEYNTFTGFPPVTLPLQKDPDIDLSELNLTFQLYADEDVEIDYLMLVPVNNFLRISRLEQHRGLYLSTMAQSMIASHEYTDRGWAAPIDPLHLYGDLPLFLDPGDNDLAVLHASGLQNWQYGGVPSFMPNIFYYYDPMWLLVPEE